MATAGAAFSVRFLNNGDQITVVSNIVNRNGDGAALFQAVDTTTGTVAPNWDATGKTGDAQTAVLNAQPIIQLGLSSARGYSIEINSVLWAYDGQTLNFPAYGSDWVTATNDSRFQARINGDKYELKIIGNLASVDVVANKSITYSIDYTSNAMNDTVRGDLDVLIQAAGANSYMLQITTNRVQLDETNTKAKLTAVGYYGISPVAIGSDGYTIEWYQGDEKLTGQTKATLDVTRDMVEGGDIFIAKLLKDGNVVAQDAQRINDIADEYQIIATPTNAGSNYCGVNHDAVYTLSLAKNGKPVTDAVSYTWQVLNANGVITNDSGMGATVTVTAENCKVSSGSGAYYADCDVRVTATF